VPFWIIGMIIAAFIDFAEAFKKSLAKTHQR
jgi:hypothetical protein